MLLLRISHCKKKFNYYEHCILFLSFSCFLSHPGAFWGAFLVPILAVMVVSVVIFIWVIVILVRHTRGTAARKKEAVSSKTIIRLMISISGVMFLFGLTWLFAILTFSAPGLRETFQALFTVFNSFQGFFIFLFFCVFSKEAREYWKEVLSCGRYTSQFLHPSQTRNISSSGAFAKKIKKAIVSTGISSLSAEKSGYASETISKVSNHYESNTIVKQVAASQVEKIPLDYEYPKRSTEALEPITKTSAEIDSRNCTPIPKDQNGTDEAIILVVETTFGEAESNTQQTALMNVPSTSDKTDMIIESPLDKPKVVNTNKIQREEDTNKPENEH